MEEVEYLGAEIKHTPSVLQDIRKCALNKAEFSDQEAQGSRHITVSDANSTPHSLAFPLSRSLSFLHSKSSGLQ